MDSIKIAVYAITKNEEKNVLKWYKSMSEADGIFVLDTGSSDNTVKLLKECGCIVKEQIIKPWRFDVARNINLEMIPNEYDYCVCTDLDEEFKPGWKDELIKLIKDYNPDRIYYKYNWQLIDNKPVVSFWYDKIHIHNKKYYWVYPVHEVLNKIDNEKYISTDKIILNHYPDLNKSRSSYLNLLKLAIKENPNIDRYYLYLGREYTFYNNKQNAIKYLNKYLKMNGTKSERSYAFRLIANIYMQDKKYVLAKRYYLKSINELSCKSVYIELGYLEYLNKNYLDSIMYLIKASLIKPLDLYIESSYARNETLYDLLSLDFYNLGKKDEALFFVNKALDINNKNERILKNKEIFEK